ncbi:MAG TPA: ABC transporter permease subunit [Gammaproteobacteria bacterium]|nr:ABC transporter permease subunit [Gammaproteobacteria bacterium]
MTSTLSPSPKAAGRGWRARMFKDRLAHHAVGVGGVGVIIAILLIFFYLLYVVIPLFESAELKSEARYEAPGGAGATLYLAMEEQREIGVRFTAAGKVVFFRTQGGEVVRQVDLPLPPGTSVTAFATALPASGVVALGLSDGQALVVRHKYEVTYPGDRRLITPEIGFPLGEDPITVDELGRPLVRLAVAVGEEGATLAASVAGGDIRLVALSKEVSFLDEEETWEREAVTVSTALGAVRFLIVEPEQRNLYVALPDGRLHYFDIVDKSGPRLVQTVSVVPKGRKLTALQLLVGGISLLVGDDHGGLSQWFPVRDEQNNYSLKHVRDFDPLGAAITAIAPEQARKGFLVADREGSLGVYHATAHRTLMVTPLSSAPLTALAVAPRANALLAEDSRGRIQFAAIRNEHPEVSWSALWGKVWYEGYSEPKYIWQSSSASNDFEPKFSLMPISFGTLKAAFYAMLMAVPLAILGAMYTAHFMAPGMRRLVKPSVEVMEALPTVILGFLAGLWLAPYVEARLPGIFSLLLVVPLGILLAAYLWSRLPVVLRSAVPEGWEPALLVPVVALLGWLSMVISPALETAWFDGDMRQWLSHDLGIPFDQRNSLVVGLAMGFAVVPTIFSIAEDAIFGVPKHLTQGSLALGATPWQTLVYVVLLTASPGIFSAVMIGFGRAVGETMIVLMATGNTPVMDFSVFQGMRTLAANIAVEMPESEVDSTHYRVLFLAALVLFLFTFFFNTLAELVRQRLRRKYSSL